MGVEYRALLERPLRRDEEAEFIEALSSQNDWSLVRTDERLRAWRIESPERCHWPEDVTLQFEVHSVYVRFDSGSRTLRARVIGLLDALLASMGLRASFVEI